MLEMYRDGVERRRSPRTSEVGGAGGGCPEVL